MTDVLFFLGIKSPNSASGQAEAISEMNEQVEQVILIHWLASLPNSSMLLLIGWKEGREIARKKKRGFGDFFLAFSQSN
jgi:hypothetical protein